VILIKVESTLRYMDFLAEQTTKAVTATRKGALDAPVLSAA